MNKRLTKKQYCTEILSCFKEDEPLSKKELTTILKRSPTSLSPKQIGGHALNQLLRQGKLEAVLTEKRKKQPKYRIVSGAPIANEKKEPNGEFTQEHFLNGLINLCSKYMGNKKVAYEKEIEALKAEVSYWKKTAAEHKESSENSLAKRLGKF